MVQGSFCPHLKPVCYPVDVSVVFPHSPPAVDSGYFQLCLFGRTLLRQLLLPFFRTWDFDLLASHHHSVNMGSHLRVTNVGHYEGPYGNQFTSQHTLILGGLFHLFIITHCTGTLFIHYLKAYSAALLIALTQLDHLFVVGMALINLNPDNPN
jgi:hypothetical protein